MTIEEYTEMSIRESLKTGNAALKACKDRQKVGVEYTPTQSAQNAVVTKDKGAQALIYVVITVLAILIIATLIAISTNH